MIEINNHFEAVLLCKLILDKISINFYRIKYDESIDDTLAQYLELLADAWSQFPFPQMTNICTGYTDVYYDLVA